MKIGRLLLYLILVLLFGGAGCWIALGQHLYNPEIYGYNIFLSNLGTFSVSVGVLAYADRILSRKQIDPTIALLIFFLMISSSAISVISIVVPFRHATISVLIGMTGAFGCWTMVKWKSPEFTDTTDPFSTLGGKETTSA